MSRFIREIYRNFESYKTGEQPRDAEYVKLNTNESPFPPAPAVCRAVNAVDMERLRLYPDPTGRVVKKKLAALYGVAPENVLLSNGSDDILNFAFMAFNGREDPLVLPDVTYSFYKVAAGLHEIPYEIKPLKEDMTVDWKGYCGIHKNIVLPNPNAPTGIALTRDQIEEIVRTNPDNVVLIDEAYIDFGAESAVPLVSRYDNLIVSQTFSKSRSFAGGRLGFAIADPELIEDLAKMQYSTNPYNVNTMSLILAEAAIEADDYYKNNSRIIQRNREETASALTEMGFCVLPSLTNFLLVKHDRIDGEPLYQRLKQRGVLVRHFPTHRIAEYIRITIGSREQMEILIRTLREILSEEEI